MVVTDCYLQEHVDDGGAFAGDGHGQAVDDDHSQEIHDELSGRMIGQDVGC